MLFFILVFTACLCAFIGWNILQNRSFEETFYQLSTDKLQSSLRAVVISDLHQLSFGEDNQVLCDRVKALKPELIILAGDILDRTDPNPAFVLSLCEKLTGIAPVYYGLGNHENRFVYGDDLVRSFLETKPELAPGTMVDFRPIEKQPLLDELRNLGVHIVQNGMETVEFNGEQLEIGGVSTNLNSFWDYSGQFIWNWAENGSDHFKILICHRPHVVMNYIPDYPFDLVLSGHLHGGGWRVPGIGGLYGGDMGWFPSYASGAHRSGDMTLIVSRGFAGYRIVPRILNKPELVIVDIN